VSRPDVTAALEAYIHTRANATLCTGGGRMSPDGANETVRRHATTAAAVWQTTHGRASARTRRQNTCTANNHDRTCERKTTTTKTPMTNQTNEHSPRTQSSEQFDVPFLCDELFCLHVQYRTRNCQPGPFAVNLALRFSAYRYFTHTARR